jgi:hypothetical protein
MECAEALLGITPSDRQFVSLFGVSIEDFEILLIFGHDLPPRDVLWMLYFLKNYPTEEVGGTWARVSAKTWRTRVCEMAKLLSDALPPVSCQFFPPDHSP